MRSRESSTHRTRHHDYSAPLIRGTDHARSGRRNSGSVICRRARSARGRPNRRGEAHRSVHSQPGQPHFRGNTHQAYPRWQVIFFGKIDAQFSTPKVTTIDLLESRSRRAVPDRGANAAYQAHRPLLRSSLRWRQPARVDDGTRSSSSATATRRWLYRPR